ncbi:hypothetical protein C2E23DRAFT_524152 [Lenzites betulinus]|nr:hypothetical protein C2E23DRAFT_524152 [Lenzites betulinus]
MHLLDLPDDVLILICSHLHGRDALNVALTSKQLVDLALPRVAAVITCWKPSMLRKLHAYMVNGPAQRARHIQVLSIDTHTFGGYDPEEANTSDDGEQPGDDLYYAANFSQANIIGGLLMHAQNIQELCLERFQPCLRRDPRIGVALASMPRLTKLRLSTLGDYTLEVLRSCSFDLRHLTLSYFIEEDYPLEGETRTLPALLSTLALYRNLHIVKLWNFTPHTCFSEDFIPPQLPSITYLRLSESTPPALNMVELCPNLNTLIYSEDPQAFDFADELNLRHLSGKPWPDLRRLMLGEHDEIPSVRRRLARVEQLHIGGVLSNSEADAPDVARFFALLRQTSPVELYLSVRVRHSPILFLSHIPPLAPRLRVLELKVSIPSPSLDYDGWLDNIPQALSDLPIPCLRLFFPQLGYPAVPRFFPAGLEYDDAEDKARGAEAREMERRRAAAMHALPQRIADAMPSLRYLALLDEGPNQNNLALQKGEEGARGSAQAEVPVETEVAGAVRSEPGEDAPVYEWDELRQTDWIRSHRWWRIVDGAEGGSRKLEAISIQEGKRLEQQIIEGAGQQDATTEELSGAEISFNRRSVLVLTSFSGSLHALSM